MRMLRTLITLLFAVCAGSASAQSYPSKSIRWIVAFPPGGGADVLSRMLSPKISEALGQQIIIDNRGGAGGNIGAEIAAKSPPDGYTILFAYSGTHSVNRSIYSKMPFQESDFAPIIWTASVPQVLVVHPSVPVKNVKELIALAKSRPDQLIYGSTGSGAINHLAGELFKMMTGTKMVHVPYKGGGPVSIALLSGEVGVLFAEPATIIQHIKAGKVRPLAVTTAKRSLGLPDLPIIADSGVPGYEVTSWNGMLIPAGTPVDIVKRLNAEFNKAISAPDMRSRMIANGYEPVGGEPERFSALIRSETAKWAKVAAAAGMKVD
ncbi:MAG: tripartite tricarboxylate transporter substrate binding protein [Sulfuricaulis sp.]|nr:tripartite tricarboxylate transporter substrate binding protein [Sulfuricaulis sp.]